MQKMSIFLICFIGIPPDIGENNANSSNNNAPDNHKGGAAPNVIGARDRGTHGHLLTPEGLSLGFSFHNESVGRAIEKGEREFMRFLLPKFGKNSFTLCNKSDAFKWVLAVVYGPAQVEKKELFLAELKNKPLTDQRWPFLFNVVIDGLNLKEIEMDGFHDMITSTSSYITSYYKGFFKIFTKVLTNRLSDIANNLR
ncbi:hypothetical protein ACJX0J_034763 [Zea mays]